ncbi:MAG: glutamyl-tRNA reductase [Acidobacteria bacterium]|nr:glutamyl-tRNA reductase [Acidobacteriota bacterium]
MNLQLLGLNHKTAPVEVREQLAVPEADLRAALERLMHLPEVSEGMILSTCNRVEIVAQTTSGSVNLRHFLNDYFHLDSSVYDQYLYEYRELEVVRHVFRVAASLDSMVVGEAQILGQLKEAYFMARAAGAVHSYLELLLTRAFAVAKRVRSETAIGSSSVSVASAAVELAGKIFGSLKAKTICLVGAGKMSVLAARRLLAEGAGPILIANRSYDRADKLAKQIGGKAIPFEELYRHSELADIVITSTGSPAAIFRREHGERFLSRRKNRPMFFIDIAVPRDVDPEMNLLDGIFLYDIDDLQSAVSSGLESRKKEAEEAEAIVEIEVGRFQARLQSLHLAPTIVSLHDQFENIRQAELERVRGRLGKLTPEQEMAIEALSRGIVNKILHTPIRSLKSAASGQEITTLIASFKKIFDLQEKPASPPEVDHSPASPRSHRRS